MERFPFRKQLTLCRTLVPAENEHSPIPPIKHSSSGSALLPSSKITLTPSEFDTILPKLEKIRKFLEQSRDAIVNSTNILIQSLNTHSKTALNQLIEFEFNLITFQNSAKKGKAVFHKDLIKIQDFFIPDQILSINIDALQREIKKIFELNPEELGKRKSIRNTSELICAKDYIAGLQSIDLKTFQVTSVPYAPRVFPYSLICAIDQHRFFINGGYNGKESVANTCMINTHTSTYENLPCSINRDAGGIVHKDNKVYIFGGIQKKGVDLDICEYFDLETYDWHRLSPLPAPSHANTASLVQDRILVLGFHFAHLLELEEIGFKTLIRVPDNCMKFIFENWIVTPNELFEFNPTTGKWSKYCFAAPLKFGWLFTFTSYRCEKFIYFIDDLNGLLRIDTAEKKIDKIV